MFEIGQEVTWWRPSDDRRRLALRCEPQVVYDDLAEHDWLSPPSKPQLRAPGPRQITRTQGRTLPGPKKVEARIMRFAVSSGSSSLHGGVAGARAVAAA
jgi:hypothetical protein